MYYYIFIGLLIMIFIMIFNNDLLNNFTIILSQLLYLSFLVNLYHQIFYSLSYIIQIFYYLLSYVLSYFMNLLSSIYDT